MSVEWLFSITPPALKWRVWNVSGAGKGTRSTVAWVLAGGAGMSVLAKGRR